MRSIAAFGALLFVAGCGGEAASPAETGGTGGVGVGGSAGVPGTGSQPGTGGAPAKGVFAWPPEKPSFTLTMTEKESSITGPAFGEARLDLREDAGGFVAALGSEVTCNVAVSASAVSLSGCSKNDQTTVEELVLPRALDGALTGTFQAVSRYQGMFQGDMLMNETTKFSGTVELDTKAPKLTAFDGPSPPWEGARIEVSEGVDEKQLVAAASVAPLTTITWKAEPGTPAWSGSKHLVGSFGDWAALADGPSLQISLSAVSDLNGNPSDPVKGTLPVLAMGKALVAHDFEAGLSVAASGNVALESATGVCESGACVSMGPGNKCDGGAGMLRGLIVSSGKTTVRLRSRVVADAVTQVPEFELQLFAPSGEKSTTKVGHFDGAATTPVLSLGYGQSFADDVVPLPAAASVVGFALYLKGGPYDYFCNPGAKAALLLEKIAAE